MVFSVSRARGSLGRKTTVAASLVSEDGGAAWEAVGNRGLPAGGRTTSPLPTPLPPFLRCGVGPSLCDLSDQETDTASEMVWAAGEQEPCQPELTASVAAPACLPGSVSVCALLRVCAPAAATPDPNTRASAGASLSPDELGRGAFRGKRPRTQSGGRPLAPGRRDFQEDRATWQMG